MRGSGIRGYREKNGSKIVLPFLHISLISFILLNAFLLASCVYTQEFKEMKAEDLKKLIDEGANVIIIDSRSEFEYKEGRIPKAIHVPQERLYTIQSFLPKEKDIPLVFYCKGYG